MTPDTTGPQMGHAAFYPTSPKAGELLNMPVKHQNICYTCSKCGIVVAYEEQPCPLCAARSRIAEIEAEIERWRASNCQLRDGMEAQAKRANDAEYALLEAKENHAKEVAALTKCPIGVGAPELCSAGTCHACPKLHVARLTRELAEARRIIDCLP